MLIKKNENIFELFPEISLRNLVNRWEAFKKETEEWEEECQRITDSCKAFNDSLMTKIIPDEATINSKRNYEINTTRDEIDSIGESLRKKYKEYDSWCERVWKEKDVLIFFNSSTKKHALKQSALIETDIRSLSDHLLSLSSKLQQYTGGYRCLEIVNEFLKDFKSDKTIFNLIKDLLFREKKISEILPEVSCGATEFKKYNLHHSLGNSPPCYVFPKFKFQESSLRTQLKEVILPKRPDSLVELKRGHLRETINLLDKDFDITIVRKVIEKKEQKRAGRDSVNALAAAHLNKTRSLAGKIKKGLESQMRIINSCPYCEKPFDDDSPHADHIYPVSKGGLSTHKNMVYICSTCNMKKANKTLREFIKENNLDRCRIEKNLELLKKSF